MRPLSRDFYSRKTTVVAQDLLGKLLVKQVDGLLRTGKIVEVEAYLGPHDLAAHTSKGLTSRTKVMFGPPGYAYVYLIYGIHHCMNIVTEPDGTGAAVLLRALEPVANISVNTNGPGRLCKAMGIDRSNYGHDLCSGDFFIAEPLGHEDITIIQRPRIGVDYAGEWAGKLLRFYIEGNRYVSKK
ncbi:DNA-3-methyladenine glycosylase [Candidimonas sp. SYP-B2681]|uniref:DNA-3-methyladenine glycosylase n=1 Tax=Candidimonas sp. SYP-B2681 TaxID=2497686 RepID=UPI000F87A5C8|nr:DNA-3-methyladenine glycosylase [Candidimonas sp. SYP-B2681]RTZ44549.1 DNA-3-methyladenine glycosylase [Candidimonas sp. SYP-B2681]